MKTLNRVLVFSLLALFLFTLSGCGCLHGWHGPKGTGHHHH